MAELRFIGLRAPVAIDFKRSRKQDSLLEIRSLQGFAHANQVPGWGHAEQKNKRLIDAADQVQKPGLKSQRVSFHSDSIAGD